MPAADDRRLNVHEAAALANVSPKTVRRWLREGLLRGARLPGGRRWRIRAADLAKVLQPTT